MKEKRVSTSRICFLNLGFLGQAYVWGLCYAFVGPIFEYLGAKPNQIAIFWLAGPVMGTITQLVIGKWSDWHWSRFGRRKPFILVGAIVIFICFLLFVYSGSLEFAIIVFWFMMTAACMVQGAYRSLIADILPGHQVSTGFIIQYIFAGVGTSVAYFSPWILTHLGVSNVSVAGQVPLIAKLSFEIGAVIILTTVLISCAFTKEDHPEDLEAFKIDRKRELNIKYATIKTLNGLFKMPKIMWQVSLAMFFSCLGTFLMGIYFAPAVAENIFGGSIGSTLYTKGVVWAGFLFAMYSVFSVIFSLFMPLITKYITLKLLFSITMIVGGVALISLLFIKDPILLLIPMIGVGIMYAGNQTIPYAIIGDSSKDEDVGTSMGIFNIFTTLPQAFVGIFFGFFMLHVLGNNSLYAVAVGGVFLLVSAVCALFIQYRRPKKSTDKSIDPIAAPHEEGVHMKKTLRTAH
ncbi:MAG: MFS transporter [bacterium]|nr:MFS transporter [bacterium]